MRCWNWAAADELLVLLGMLVEGREDPVVRERLAELELVEHIPYRGVRLTDLGRLQALRILRRHRVIETYLTQRLDFSWDEVHDEAELLEHAASDRLVEAMAVIPYFCGAKGVVVWGWEPGREGQYYQNLPLFAESLGRISDISDRLSKAELVIDEPAHVLWKEKRPLVRKLKLDEDEWVGVIDRIEAAEDGGLPGTMASIQRRTGDRRGVQFCPVHHAQSQWR